MVGFGDLGTVSKYLNVELTFLSFSSVGIGTGSVGVGVIAIAIKFLSWTFILVIRRSIRVYHSPRWLISFLSSCSYPLFPWPGFYLVPVTTISNIPQSRILVFRPLEIWMVKIRVPTKKKKR